MSNTSEMQIKDAFDPRAFLGLVGAGKTIERYAKNQKIYAQGDIADTILFIQKGKVKITVLSEHGKEAVVGIFGMQADHERIFPAGIEVRRKVKRVGLVGIVHRGSEYADLGARVRGRLSGQDGCCRQHRRRYATGPFKHSPPSS